MIIAPFSFDSLPKVTHADVVAQARLRGLVARLPEIERALGVLVRLGRTRGVVEGVSVPIATGEHTVIVDVETALARELVARALNHRAGIDSGKPASATLNGAFAAVLVHALRKVAPVKLGRPLQERAMVVRLEIEVDRSLYEASVTIPASVRASTAAPRTLDFPITLPLAASCLASRADVEALTIGDVFVAPLGALALVAPRAELGIAVDLTRKDDQSPRVVIRKDRFAQFSWEPPMSDANATGATLEVALEAPVVVRVELGAVEMKAREWAALAEGDVISLQRKLGEPAIVRIAGQEVARGELVQVDGEYGIRITSTTR